MNYYKIQQQMLNETFEHPNPLFSGLNNPIENSSENNHTEKNSQLPEILFINSYPPRECGVATYSQDLVKALNNKFDQSFKISICPLESDSEQHVYPDEIKYVLNTDLPKAFPQAARKINEDLNISLVMVQHEFGFFEKKEEKFIDFLSAIEKPIIIVFHTVLPEPNLSFKKNVQEISALATAIIVMTNTSAKVLQRDYGVLIEKITVIAHGTHLVAHPEKDVLKAEYHLAGKKILSTFGLLSSGKSIETTLDALPAIVAQFPNILFLIIGKTHPSIVKQEGEKYRQMLQKQVETLHLQENVKFINQFLPLHDLLAYLQLTDIYLFTSNNPNQAVSGTFAYAISCGCPIISTPIPHAKEVLQNDSGIIIDFGQSKQLSKAVISLLEDEKRRKDISSNGLHQMASTAWENAAIAHALMFEKISQGKIVLKYNFPAINLEHLKKMTTNFGMIQFAKINQPDINSGYTLDDNARALVAMCQYFELTKEATAVVYIQKYFDFIKFCLQSKGDFLNYVDDNKHFTSQNHENLDDSNGRALWALGFLVSMGNLLPEALIENANETIEKALDNVTKIHSTRGMAFIIKGLYYRNLNKSSEKNQGLIKELANRLVQMYRHEATKNWVWYESYLTYANSILPEAMLCAYLATNEPLYKEIAKTTFDFLLSKTFSQNSIKVISNKTWLHKGMEAAPKAIGGEQPIDVAYTILALNKFYEVFKDENYLERIKTSFNWFLGANHLHQIIYNPCTGGCYDGLEENYVNLNQGAESTVSYLMARLVVEKRIKKRNVTTRYKELVPSKSY
jgi:glycosyltransferase involved in cell wall biosynthesis